jgi:hypothetical protein
MPEITTWAVLVEQIDGSALINGEVDATGRELLRGSGGALRCVSAGGRLRRAGFLAEMGWTALQHGEYPEGAASVNPIYLKEP